MHEKTNIPVDDKLYIHIGKHVRKARKRLGWTQEQLAEAINISLSFCGHIERGSRKCSVITLAKLCKALSLDANEALRLNNPRWLMDDVTRYDFTSPVIDLAKELLSAALELAETL